MTRKHIVIALVFLATMSVASNAFATACSSGVAVQFLGVGSSAQFNTLAYAAEDVLTPAGWNMMSFKSSGTDFGVIDQRSSVEGLTTASQIDSASWWVAWDNNATCNVYAYASVDSGIGVKCFQSSIKASFNSKSYNVAGCIPNLQTCLTVLNGGGTGASCSESKFTQSIVGGLADNALVMPTAVESALVYNPYVAVQTLGAVPQTYCGVLNGSAGFYCSFNMAGTDIRPEDALYAVTRALSAYNTTNSLSGLGYAQTACGAVDANIGCQIYDAFGQGKIFNVLNFKLSGTDPIASGSVPSYTTVPVGIAPVVVFVNNADTSNFGKTYTDLYGNTSYYFRDILDKKLAEVFEGQAFCTGDLLTDGSGTGVPIQVVQREPLSGTYNTFEFTAVRTMYGSAASAVGESKISSIQWITDDESGQEIFNNPTLNFQQESCTTTVGKAVPAIPCGDPLAIYAGPNPSALPVNSKGCSTSSTTLTGGAPLRLRAIGTGEEVPAALGQYNSTTSGASSPSTPFSIVDGIGYAFWSYGNFAPMTSGQSGCSTTNPLTCPSYDGHYITVSGVDPFFWTEGGEGDPTPNQWGAFNTPQCLLGALPCVKVPFYHIYDGKYPLWSLLRLVTFENVSGKSETPAAVLTMAAYDQIEVANGSRNTSDFVPLLTNICAPGSQWNGTTCGADSGETNWNGNLNAWVFRSHYKQSSVNPNNGHVGCTGGLTSSTFINIVGGSSSGATCLVDTGGDVGGVPLTVQDDLDFILYFGGYDFPPVAPKEVYNLHQ